MELAVNQALAAVMRELIPKKVREELESHAELLKQLEKDGFKICGCGRWSNSFTLCIACLSRSHCKYCRRTTKRCADCGKNCCLYLLTCYKACPIPDCECTRTCYFCLNP
jgi:hypothetical protein